MKAKFRRGAVALATMALVVACAREAPLVSLPVDAPSAVALRDVRVFDAQRAAVLDGRWDVVVREGRIAAIGRPGFAKGSLHEIDGRGSMLLPGLVDLHTHTASPYGPPSRVSFPDLGENLAAFLYAGVTTVLDLGSLAPAVFRDRERVSSGDLLGPRFFAAGPIFTAPGGHPVNVLRTVLPWYVRWYVLPRASREVATPEEARLGVAELLAERPDLIKISNDSDGREDLPRMSTETILAITEAGHEAGVRTIAHVGTSEQVIEAVRGGVDALAHAPWSEEISDEALTAIAEAKVPVVVTLAIWDVVGTPRRGQAEFLSIEREIAPPEVIEALLAPAPEPAPEMAVYLGAAAAARDARRRNVARLREAGVPILVGSDACGPGQLPGAGLHLELRKLVEAGLSPAEALQAATWENAAFLLGENPDLGEIAVGKRADLVLVDGDPTERIDDLARITHVLLGGVVLDRRKREMAH